MRRTERAIALAVRRGGGRCTHLFGRTRCRCPRHPFAHWTSASTFCAPTQTVLSSGHRSNGLPSTSVSTSCSQDRSDPADIVLDAPLLDWSGRCTLIESVDTYAQAKIYNFIQRQKEGGQDAGFNYTVETHSVQGTTAHAHQFHARIRLPLPSRFGERFGEGFAPTAREAEQVACMHAERVLDALGIPVFELPAKQQRHASGAARSGRLAPSLSTCPSSQNVPPHTSSPPPLQLDYSSQANRDAETPYFRVSGPPLTPLFRHTLTSPYSFDGSCVARIRSFFLAHKARFDQFSRIVSTRDGTSDGCERRRRDSCGSGDALGNSRTVLLAQIRLPISSRFGDRICCGMATDSKEAMALACMHAELTIDALGLSLFPNDAEAQRLHAKECRQLGRWATTEPGLELRYEAATPPALRCSCALDQHGQGAVSSTYGEVFLLGSHPHSVSHTPPNFSAGGMDAVELIVRQHSDAVRRVHACLEVSILDEDAKTWLSTWMTAAGHSQSGTQRSEPSFFVASLGIKGHKTYRASVLIRPASQRACESDAGEASRETVVAVGIAATPEDAETAAAMHARMLLEARTQNAIADSGVDEMEMSRNGTRHRLLGVPHAVRYIRDHVGRIIVPGLRAEMRALPQQTAVSRSPLEQAVPYLMTVEQVAKELRDAQATLPPQQWSLASDGAHRIIVSPSASCAQGSNYVHTLPGVREPDGAAVTRLRDYLERHGKDLESSLRFHVAPHEDVHNVSRWTATVRLPVPSEAVRTLAQRSGKTGAVSTGVHEGVVAHGEACSAKDALTMCAVHAELLIDALGISWYDHPILQRKHADTARKLGRWATLRDRSTGDSLAPSGSHQPGSSSLPPPLFPPPVRKEHALSPLWLKLEKERRLALPRAPLAQSGRRSSSAQSSPNTAADDALCDVSKLRRFHSTSVYRHAVKDAQFLFQSRGGDFFRALRQYSVRATAHGTIHRAIAELPLPRSYGRRTAVGCATTKRSALLACAMHALAIFGALSLALYTGRRQSQLALALAQCGVSCPQPGAALMPPTTPTPAGFFLLEHASSIASRGGDGRLEMPDPPSRDEEEWRVHDPHHEMWAAYVLACQTYIAACKDAHTFSSVTDMHCAPRSGVPVEDSGLDAVERLPLDRQTKQALALTCVHCHLPPPSFPFHCRRHNDTSRRNDSGGANGSRENSLSENGDHASHDFYLCEAPVRGTPYCARGFGRSVKESQDRCSMHYEYIARHTAANVSSIGDGSGSPGTGPAQLPTTRAKDDTSRGASFLCPPNVSSLAEDDWDRSLVAKVELMDLYAQGCCAASAVRVSSHDRPLSEATIMRVLSVELADRHSSEIIKGRSSSEVAHRGSESEQVQVNRSLFSAAAIRLYNSLLSRRTDFAHLARGLGSATAVNMSALTALSDDEVTVLPPWRRVAGAREMPQIAIACTGDDRPLSGASPLRTPSDPHRSVYLTRAADRPSRIFEAAPHGPFLTSSVVTALIELAEVRFGHSTLPSALTYPAPIRATLLGMGFVREVNAVDLSNRTMSSGDRTLFSIDATLELTDLGAAAALVVQCIPPLPGSQSSPPTATAPTNTADDTKVPPSHPLLLMGPALPLELAKLIIGAHQFSCPSLGFALVRNVAMILLSEHDEGANDVRFDVTDLGPATATDTHADVCDAFVDELQRRLALLRAHLTSCAPESPLTALLTGTASSTALSTHSRHCAPGRSHALAKLLIVHAATTELTAASCSASLDIFRRTSATKSTNVPHSIAFPVGTPIPPLIGGLCGTFRRTTTVSGKMDVPWPSSTVSAVLPNLFALTRRALDGTTAVDMLLTTANRRDNVTELEDVRTRWTMHALYSCRFPNGLLGFLCDLLVANYESVQVRRPSDFLALHHEQSGRDLTCDDSREHD